jgi:hypothetical protein
VRREPGLSLASLAPEDPAVADWPAARDLLEAWQRAGVAGAVVDALARGRFAPAALPLWVTHDGAPVLGLKRFGRGWVASSTTTPAYGWAPCLRDDPGRLAVLLRLLGRGDSEPRSAMPRLNFEDQRVWLQSVPIDWPAELELSLGRLETASGIVARPDEFGRLSAFPPERGLGGDPLGQRVGPRPPLLDRCAAGQALQVRVAWEGGPLATLLVHAPGPRELAVTGSGRTVTDLLAEGAQVGWVPARSTMEARSSPAALPLLVLALLLLVFSALQVGSGGQGPRSS